MRSIHQYTIFAVFAMPFLTECTTTSDLSPPEKVSQSAAGIGFPTESTNSFMAPDGRE
jgi:hypothetical protein